MKKDKMLYSITSVDSDFIGDTPDKILDGLNGGTNFIYYDFKNHRYLITYISDNFNIFSKIEEDRKEIERLNNIINECADDILKELKENNHLSYGVALSIRQKLIDYKELKDSDEE